MTSKRFFRAARPLLIGAVLGAGAVSLASAQTNQAPAPTPNDQAPAAQGVAPPMAPMQGMAPSGGAMQPATPAPQNLTAPGSVDPLVQKRNADARANADYRASKKASKRQYKQSVRDAKVNRKADKRTATNALKAETQDQPVNGAGDQNGH